MSFERGFDANGTRNMRQHVLKTKRFSRPGRKGKTAFRLRRRERIEGRALQETTKNIQRNATCEPARSRCRCFTEDCQKMTPKGDLLGYFWVTLDDQDGPISRQAWPSEPSRPRHEKTRRFLWPRGLNIVKHVFWRGPEWNSAAGAVHLWQPRKTTIW